MFALRDTLWKNVRNTITPAFTTGKMKTMTPILGDCIEQMMSAIEKTIEDINGEFDVKKVCGNLTMDAIARCAFGVYTNVEREEESEFVKNAKEFFSFTFRDPRVLFICEFMTRDPIWLRILPKRYNQRINSWEGQYEQKRGRRG
ncbi:unnamed protein product [Toxocara canis]|uniref:Cytochrome P450 n=1 Tax=Toxocara canis TaxID=6265 RepID=A0A183U3U6_TOXCA|nr:unnamed protein product [Toxocara canis]